MLIVKVTQKNRCYSQKLGYTVLESVVKMIIDQPTISRLLFIDKLSKEKMGCSVNPASYRDMCTPVLSVLYTMTVHSPLNTVVTSIIEYLWLWH